MTNRQAIVRIDGQGVGTINEDGMQTVFHYSAMWLTHPNRVPVSLTLPLRAEPYITTGLHPFSENLLPEGWLLELATAKLKISKDDAFGLLISTCADCLGVVESLMDVV